ncbi:hypothetical protein GLYMA_14G082400v4 [Glycine max]|uniref:EF-hand domain-containing protein n=2 Tax=Glycine subgen. Soja TaxID=1462606 RepID=K7M5L0_SOYBN|nr:calmodulin-like protein 5 [Glycine soja]KAH1093636.1 hypothetical protein GYH30_039394 [Glycine max]KAG4953527.1 hypothetical protein JHK87_039121 [Glycine soja]KHN35674.1 hypothetical protein glysoja_037584 [Glycine soja]KRH15350.1 hypothetical protein GLYMA_14G082400v4 [Glycine max]RZB68066.1 hypothetical protein D0Y65_038045 [Glycine soja]
MPVRIPRDSPMKIIPDPNRKTGPDDAVIMQKIMGKLREADSNNDGRYDKDELKHALKGLGAILPGWRANRCFGRVDANHDGEISGAEIEALLQYLRSHGLREGDINLWA